MEPHRQVCTVRPASPRRQAGITAIGFLILASVFGLVGFAGIKLAPLFMQKATIGTVMADLKAEYDGTGTATGTIRRNLVQRLYLEGIRVRPDDVVITPSTNGYTVGLKYDNRTSFLGGVSFVVEVDQQIEIRR
jgi:multidrug efflux pump subunit AcrA (membrane-fusion protein)